MVEKDSSMSDVEYFTSLAKGTTLQVSSRNKFVNDIPSTLLQVATDKTKTSRPSDGTLPFLQQALVSVPNLWFFMQDSISSLQQQIGVLGTRLEFLSQC